MPSVCKRHMEDKGLVLAVAQMYRTTMSTVQQVADHFEVNHVTAREMIRQHIPDGKFKMLAAYRYAESKTGDKNPQKGRKWASECEDGYGYLTRLVDGVRYQVQRIVWAEYMGLHPSQLPKDLTIHHIDEDPTNNSLDNLAACTRKGHPTIHARYQADTLTMRLRKSSVREYIRYMTSKSP